MQNPIRDDGKDCTVTRLIWERWGEFSAESFGAFLRINSLNAARIGHVVSEGDPPLLLVDGRPVLEANVTYNIEELKNECWLD